MNESIKPISVDIGNSGDKHYLEKVKKHPERSYVLIGNDQPEIEVLDSLDNLVWYFGGITEHSKIPVGDNVADEVNLDFYLRNLQLEKDFDEESARLALQEAVRIVKQDGIIYIRESKYMIEPIEELLKELDIEYEIKPMSKKVAKTYSDSSIEAIEEYESGRKEMRPYVITARKHS